MAENHHLCWIPANLPLSCRAPLFLPAAAEGGAIVLYLQETPLILDHSTPLAPVDLISVVVPGFNEEGNVPKIYAAVRATLVGERFEMIFVDDGSSYGTADYRLLDREAIQGVLQFRDRQPFWRGLIPWLGFSTTQLEYAPRARTEGHSGYSWRKMLRLSLRALTGVSSKPLRASFYLGLVTAVFCLIYSVYAIVALANGKTVPGWTSVIVAVTFLGAVQLVSVGILGEYIGRIYEQTRGTPRYVVVERDEPPVAEAPPAPAKRPGRPA
jgi:glycosyltransferase involved in cell wall biosynthesis